MSLGKFLFSRIFLRHFMLSTAATLIIILIINQLLSVYTRHGQNIVVPDLKGLTPEEIINSTTGSNFKLIVLDSVYDDRKPRGSVVQQDPLPGSKVKRNRKIYLTTVAMLPEKVIVPDLLDLTLRQALATLETYGLKPGKLSYAPDIARNAVIKQIYKGKTLAPGTELERKSQIDLVLGTGIGGENMAVPMLLGMTPAEVHSTLMNLTLNLGAEFYSQHSDSARSRVFRQNPSYSPDAFIKLGQTIDVWYKTIYEVDFDSLRQANQPSSEPD